MDGVFPYHHYHSTSHEVPCVIGGSASITFGGPQGESIEVSAGDAALPKSDPHFGEEGPLILRWSG